MGIRDSSSLRYIGANDFISEDGRFAVGVDEPTLTPGDVVRGAEVNTCFTPAQPCGDSIVTRINEARSEIRVQAYGFTSPPILSALASAKERGLDVAVILDKSNDRSVEKSRYSGATFVAHAGIPVFIDYRPAIAHNKIIIIDHHLVITGSYNFTRRAPRNAENVTFIDSTEVQAGSSRTGTRDEYFRGRMLIMGNDRSRWRYIWRYVR